MQLCVHIVMALDTNIHTLPPPSFAPEQENLGIPPGKKLCFLQLVPFATRLIKQ